MELVHLSANGPFASMSTRPRMEQRSSTASPIEFAPRCSGASGSKICCIPWLPRRGSLRQEHKWRHGENSVPPIYYTAHRQRERLKNRGTRSDANRIRTVRGKPALERCRGRASRRGAPIRSHGNTVVRDSVRTWSERRRCRGARQPRKGRCGTHASFFLGALPVVEGLERSLEPIFRDTHAKSPAS